MRCHSFCSQRQLLELLERALFKLKNMTITDCSVFAGFQRFQKAGGKEAF